MGTTAWTIKSFFADFWQSLKVLVAVDSAFCPAVVPKSEAQRLASTCLTALDFSAGFLPSLKPKSTTCWRAASQAVGLGSFCFLERLAKFRV